MGVSFGGFLTNAFCKGYLVFRYEYGIIFILDIAPNFLHKIFKYGKKKFIKYNHPHRIWFYYKPVHIHNLNLMYEIITEFIYSTYV